jgi:hypothetical protein
MIEANVQDTDAYTQIPGEKALAACNRRGLYGEATHRVNNGRRE